MNYMPPYIEATYKDEATKGDYALKVTVARNALITYPQDKDYLLAHIAVFLQYDKQFEECIAHCRSALPQIENPECYEEVERFLGFALHSAGRLQEAIEFHKLRLATTGDEAEVLEEIATLYDELKDDDNALKYYELLIAAGEELDAPLHIKLAAMYEGKKDYVNAFRHYMISARKKPELGFELWCDAGRVSVLIDKTDDALFYFKMSMALNPDYALPHYLTGWLYHDRDDVYRAMHHYLEALKLQPDYPEAINNMAAINYTEHSDIKAAIQLLDEALQMTVPDELRTTIYINMIRLHKQIGDYDKQEYYNGKLLESLGFPPGFSGDENADDFDTGDDE